MTYLKNVSNWTHCQLNEWTVDCTYGHAVNLAKPYIRAARTICIYTLRELPA